MSSYRILAYGVTLLLAFLQTLWPSSWKLWGAAPDFAMAVLVLFALKGGQMEGQLIGLALGLMMDFLSAGPFGLYTLCGVLTGALIGSFKGKIYADRVVFPLLLGMGATLFRGFIVALVSLLYRIPFTHRAFHPGNPGFWFFLLMEILLCLIAFNTLGRLSLFNKKELQDSMSS